MLRRHDLQRGNTNQPHKCSIRRIACPQNVGRQPADSQRGRACVGPDGRAVVMWHPPVTSAGEGPPSRGPSGTVKGLVRYVRGEITDTSSLHKI